MQKKQVKDLAATKTADIFEEVEIAIIININQYFDMGDNIISYLEAVLVDFTAIMDA